MNPLQDTAPLINHSQITNTLNASDCSAFRGTSSWHRSKRQEWMVQAPRNNQALRVTGLGKLRSWSPLQGLQHLEVYWGDPLPGRIYTGQRKPASPIKRFSAMWGLAPQAQTGMLRSLYFYARQDYSKNNGGQSLLLEDRKDSPWTRIKRFQGVRGGLREG